MEKIRKKGSTALLRIEPQSPQEQCDNKDDDNCTKYENRNIRQTKHHTIYFVSFQDRKKLCFDIMISLNPGSQNCLPDHSREDFNQAKHIGIQ